MTSHKLVTFAGIHSGGLYIQQITIIRQPIVTSMAVTGTFSNDLIGKLINEAVRVSCTQIAQPLPTLQDLSQQKMLNGEAPTTKLSNTPSLGQVSVGPHFLKTPQAFSHVC